MFFLRLLYHSFQRQPRRKLLAGAAVTLGAVLATAMITVANDVEDRISQELRAIGANIVVRPDAESLDLTIPGTALRARTGDAFLNEADIPKIKHTFWSHNILGVTPMLTGTVALGDAQVPLIGTWFEHSMALNNETFVTGVTKTHKWWKLNGRWPQENADEVVIGKRIGVLARIGEPILLGGQRVIVTGIVATGGSEDDAIVAPLHLSQRLLNQPGRVQSIYVSALTKPEDDFARRDPKSMPPAVLERWMCSPYANSIAYQIEQAVPGARASVVRAVAQNEGAVLSRISGLMLLITIAALLAAIVGVSSAMATSLFERQQEIGLLRSLGATRNLIGTMFVLESAVLAVVSGVFGFVFGGLVARLIATRIFGSPVSANLALLPLVILIALGVTIGGSWFAIRRAMRVLPSIVLRGEAA